MKIMKMNIFQQKSVRKNVISFLLIVIGLLIFNRHLFSTEFPFDKIFYPLEVIQGEWLRVFSCQFIHVSWYHFLIDSLAFVVIWFALNESLTKKIIAVLCCSIGAVTGSLFFRGISVTGYCGLSGMTHGLFMILALQFFYKKETVSYGTFMFIILLAKCMIEVLTGKMVLLNMHTGNLGIPVVMSHTGGMLAGGLIFYFFNRSKR